MKQKDISISCADGVRLAGSLYEPEAPPKAGVVICSALGVPRQFYKPFAMWLSENGYAVMTFDYRGIGDSIPSGIRGRDIVMADWGTQDIDAVFKYMLERQSPSKLFAVGHSAGGQLIGIAPTCEKLSGIILAPASSANWRLYPFPSNIGFYLLWHFLIPIMCVGRDMFPAKKLGISTMNVPRGVMSQWARWARRRRYLFSPTFGIDIHRYAKLSLPLLAFGFDDDRYASEKAVGALLAIYSSAKIDRFQIDTNGLGGGKVGHFGFFKEKLRSTLWQQTLEWLDDQSEFKPDKV